MSTIRIGRLRHRIAIQSATETRDANGDTTKAWATEDTVWGEIQPLTGSELITAQQQSARITHRIIMRYQSGITPAKRLVHSSRTFGIVSVANPFERDRYLEIMAVEEVV